MAEFRVLNAQEVRQALPMAEAIEGMKSAYAQLSSGRAVVPLRNSIDVANHQGLSLFMPAYLPDSDDLTIKVVSVFPQNIERGEPAIYAAVLVLNAETGRPLALMEGGSLTAIRTGAGSGAATDLLARDDASSVAILGSGVQARTQLEAVCTVRAISTVRVYSPNREHAHKFAESMAGQGPVPQDIEVATSSAEAVAGVDIICAATNSTSPVLSSKDLDPGVHINGVGSFTPEMQEIDADTVRRSLVVVDSRESVMIEAGDLLVPLASGRIELSHIHAELGEIISGRKPGRTAPDQVTFFKSVGVAVQDAVAARIALGNAIARDLGTVLSF